MLSCPVVFTIVTVLHQVSSADLAGNSNFSLEYTGVVFSPYVKNRLENGVMPPWKNYSTQEILTLLDLTSTKFHHVTTYGMGVGDPNASWRDGDAAGLVPMAAAEHNSKSRKKLSLSLGIWHNKDHQLFLREYINAIEAAQEANALFPHTVWGIAVSSFSWMNYRSWNDTIHFLENFRNEVRQFQLKIGVRLEICHEIIPTKRPEDEYYKENLHSAPKNLNSGPPSNIQRIARAADFLICTTFPPGNLVGEGVEVSATTMISQMTLVEKEIKKENAVIDVWFETGWPSQGISRSGSKNSGRNMRTFWNMMAQMGKESKLHMYMFTAFDEPWKVNFGKNKTDPEGPNGAEAHYGWWRILDNNDFSKFEEKVAEPEEFYLTAGAVAGIVIALLTPVIVFLAWRLHKARQTIERISEKDIKEFMEGMPTSGKGDSVDAALQLPYDKSYELSKADFVIDETNVLGSGAFGVVHKGKINGIEGVVAFKKPNKDVSVAQLKNLLSEIKIMIYIGRHENVVVLLGAYTEQIREGVVYIASECCSLGSLESHLRSIPRTFTAVGYENINPTDAPPSHERYVNTDRKPVEITTSIPKMSLYKWSYQIASGMEYLASKRVVHADLATRNVLLTENGTAKISDFGLSRRLYEYTQYVKCSQEPLPWRWMAIESLRCLSFSTTSDVWSYGVTVWEIFSLGDMPYPGLSWDITFVEQLERGLRMQLPKYATPEIYEQMTKCWNIDPNVRPTFTELKEYFEGMICEEQKLNC